MRRSVPLVSLVVAVAVAVGVAVSGVALAQEPPVTPPATDAPPATASVTASAAAPDSFLAEAPPEVPPPLPRKKGVVLESSLGALGFAGQFRHVAPTAFWMHMQVGYEFLSWLMAFAEGQLAYANTSIAQDASKAHSFPILGFGGGARATIRITERVSIYGQGSIGAMKADVPKQALFIIGFRDAEAFNPYFGGRVGVEWYQIDRHLALGFGIGVRDAQGFARLASTSDTPLMWDAALSLRYTF